MGLFLFTFKSSQRMLEKHPAENIIIDGLLYRGCHTQLIFPSESQYFKHFNQIKMSVILLNPVVQ